VGKDVVRTQAVSNGKGEVLYAFGGETLAVLVKGNLAAEKVTIYLRQRRMSGHRLLGKVRREGGREGGRAGGPNLSFRTSLPFFYPLTSTHFSPFLPSFPPFFPQVYVPVADIVNSPNSTITEILDLEAGNGSVTATFAFKALAKVRPSFSSSSSLSTTFIQIHSNSNI